MRIRKRDGTVREVGDGYILADGETLIVPLNLMDARRMIHDGNGGPVGQRPGFLVCDDEADNQAREAAYREYAATISERWRGQMTGNARHLRNKTQSEPQTFTNPEAAVAASYAEYNRAIQERWRK